MHPLVLITTHPDFAPLIAPLADAWELDLVVAPTWAAGTAIQHRGLVVYDPARTITLETIMQHSLPIVCCIHRNPTAPRGQSSGPYPPTIQFIVTPFDHEDLFLFGRKFFFRDRWPHGGPVPTGPIPSFPDLTEQWAKVAYPDRSPKPPDPSGELR